MKDFVSLANPVLAKTRNVVVKTLLKTPRVGDYIREARFKPPPTYPNGDYFGLSRSRRNGAEGRPIPQPQVRTYDGRRALLDELLGEDYALVGYACDPRASLDAKTLARLTALGARFVALYPFGGRPQGDAVKRGSAVDALIEVEDLGGEGIAWFRGAGARKGHVALIRPDKFVFAMTPPGQLTQAVERALDAFGGIVAKKVCQSRLTSDPRARLATRRNMLAARLRFGNACTSRFRKTTRLSGRLVTGSLAATGKMRSVEADARGDHNAQEAGLRGRLGKRVESTPSRPANAPDLDSQSSGDHHESRTVWERR